MSSPFTWIQTRDGSPTLWHNELGESFRSVKGAFTESWVAFNEPALRHARVNSHGRVRVGEFGLGAGTNWTLWTLAATVLGMDFEYTAIERDLSAFRIGMERWRAQTPTLASFLRERLRDFAPSLEVTDEFVARALTQAEEPRVYPSLEAACSASASFDIWFHDPFGYDVNPEGYAPETLALCHQMWAPGLWGGSYACNRRFREALETLEGVRARVMDTGAPPLKRERMEFQRQ